MNATPASSSALDPDEGLDGPAGQAVAAFQALHGGRVNAGFLGKLVHGPAEERTQRENLFRDQHAEFHYVTAKLRFYMGKMQ